MKAITCELIYLEFYRSASRVTLKGFRLDPCCSCHAVLPNLLEIFIRPILIIHGMSQATSYGAADCLINVIILIIGTDRPEQSG